MSEYITIELTKGYETIIDSEDADLVKFKWHTQNSTGKPYALRKLYFPNDVREYQHLHRVVLERKIGRSLATNEVCDHISGNTLDNRRENLRVATASQNLQNASRRQDNSSGLKGVMFTKSSGRWRARIKFNGKTKHIGYFDTPEEAHEAYWEMAKQLFGEFARKD